MTFLLHPKARSNRGLIRNPTMPPVHSELDDNSATASFCVLSDPDNTKETYDLISPRRTVLRRCSVDFVGESTVIEIENADELEREQIWYTRDEYEIIKARNSLIVKMMQKGSFVENEEHTFRGLEHKLKDGFKQRRENKFSALNSVLAEQDRQYAIGRRDYRNIAQKYEEAVLNAKEFAFFLGIKDHEQSYAYQPPDPENPVMIDDDDCSVVSDLGSICSEDTVQKKLRLRGLFGGISFRKKGKMNRRASM